MDHFQGADYIRLFEGDSNVPFRFNVTVATSSGKNDGHLPYGSTICKSTCRVHHSEGSTVGTSNIIGSVTQSSWDIMVNMNYTTEVPAGLYHMIAITKISILGSTTVHGIKNIHFNRIYIEAP
jgi:hypothetical protein